MTLPPALKTDIDALVVLILGAAMLTAMFVTIPPSSKEVVLTLGGALAGYLAKQVSDALGKPPSDPPSDPGA